MINPTIPSWIRIRFISASDFYSLQSSLSPHDTLVLNLDGSQISNATEFLNQADSDFTHNTSLRSNGNWDSFHDWLWAEISLFAHHGIKTVFIAWHHADQIVINGGVQHLLWIAQALQEIWSSLPDVDVKVYLLTNKPLHTVNTQ